MVLCEISKKENTNRNQNRKEVKKEKSKLREFSVKKKKNESPGGTEHSFAHSS